MEKNMKLVRLVSGEEIVAVVEENNNRESGKSVILKDGHLLIPAGEGKIGFMPFAPYTKAKDGVEISMEHIVFIVEPLEELANQVKQMANPSQIITPPQQGIIV